MRQAQRRALRNQSARAAVRTYVKKAGLAVSGAIGDAAEAVRAAVRALDKAAQKGIVHRNAAARRKSRLMTRLHQLSLSQAEAPSAPAAAAKPARAPAKRATATTRGQTAEKKTTTTARKPAAR